MAQIHSFDGSFGQAAVVADARQCLGPRERISALIGFTFYLVGMRQQLKKNQKTNK